MKDKRSLHLKVQELCDCFATTDPLKEMSILGKEPVSEEAALKWIALAVLHGINGNARKISLTRTADGQVAVTAKYRKSDLPSPGTAVGQKVLEVMRGIIHAEEEKAKVPLALGIRDSSIDVVIRTEKDEKEEKLTINFPK
ncbi:MAG: hypothetical protein HPY84_11710 [Syntrophobacteraceae bacterium]|nr:hypothetical protein [Syntrophobacteraceae bacterium]